MLNRWIEDGLLDSLSTVGAGCIAFSPLAQGMLTGKYHEGIPADSRAAKGRMSSADLLTHAEVRERVTGLNAIAAARGQSLAQMALSWALRDQRVISALIGASSPAQLQNSVQALGKLVFSEDELHAIDHWAVDTPGVDRWRRARLRES